MKLSEKYLTRKDIDLANFAKAIALPIRVCMIRLILENGNEATRVKLHELPFNQLTINQHLAELAHLGILKSKRKGQTSLFTVNEEIFVKMSNNFLALFEAMGKLNDEAREVVSRPPLKKKAKAKLPELPLGKYVQEKRKQVGLTQEEFGSLIGLDRAHLSRIECGRKIISQHKLGKIAEVLHVPIADLHKMYYQEKMLELAKAGDITDF